MTKFKGNKFFAICLAFSAVVILAGVILYALLGFNLAPEHSDKYTFEVNYNALIGINKQEKDVEKLCEDALKANKLSYSGKELRNQVDSTTLSESDDKTLVYTFGSADEAALSAAVKAVNDAVAQNEGYSLAAVYASWHVQSGVRLSEYAWRGAIAIAVAAIVSLAYVCIRFGVSCGVAGLACCAHDALFTAALFAITRFPVYAGAPLLYAAIAAFVSVVAWTMLCGKIKEYGKSGEKLTGEECIRKAVAEDKKLVLFAVLPFAVVVAVLGAVAVGGTALFMLPALIAVAVPLYSAFLIGPEVCVPIRKAFDKKREAKLKKGKYVGKKKAAEADAE